MAIIDTVRKRAALEEESEPENERAASRERAGCGGKRRETERKIKEITRQSDREADREEERTRRE